MAAKADTWMPLYVGSYLANTSHLTTEQHGAYFLLILAAWKRGGRLPLDEGQLASVCKLTPLVWRKHRGVLLEFFELDGDAWVHDRVSEEREKAQRLSDIRQEAGRKGGRPKKQVESSEKPNGLANEKQNETPLPLPPVEPIGSYTGEASASSRPTAGVDTVRGTRLPENWTPNPNYSALDFGLTYEQHADELAKFLDYWRSVPGAKGRKTDWNATWRNWMRRASENSARKAPHERPHPDAKLAAKQANYARAWEGSERAARSRGEP